jgi:hypothetical protein
MLDWVTSAGERLGKKATAVASGEQAWWQYASLVLVFLSNGFRERVLSLPPLAPSNISLTAGEVIAILTGSDALQI